MKKAVPLGTTFLKMCFNELFAGFLILESQFIEFPVSRFADYIYHIVPARRA